MIESYSKIEHRICQISKSHPGFFQSVVADGEFPIRVLPSKGSFHLVSFPVDLSVEPSKLSSYDKRILRVSAVRIDEGSQPMRLDNCFVFMGIKS